MKKTILNLIGIFAFVSAINAQWGGPGVSSLTGDLYRTDNVGIGIQYPLSKLDVFETTALGNSSGSYQLLNRIAGSCGGGNDLIKNTWLTRYGTGPGWNNSTSLIDGISIDYTYDNPTSTVFGYAPKTWWARDPTWGVQQWGNDEKPQMTLSSGKLGIGTVSPGAKLHVFFEDDAGQGTNERFATYSRIEPVTDMPSDGYHAIEIGVGGEAVSNFQGKYIMKGVLGRAYNGLDNYGGYFHAYNGNVDWSGADCMGVYAEGTDGFHAYGIYAKAANATHNLFAGYFDGDVFCTGSYLPSDKKLKRDIQPLDNTLDKIMRLKPSTYYYKTDDFKSMSLPKGKQIGLIAQELAEVFPEITKDIEALILPDEKGNKVEKNPDFKSINYNLLIPILIKGIQQQQTQIESQQQQISELKSLISTLQGNTQPGSESGATSVPLNSQDKNSIVLSQNVPNPFAENTIINYDIQKDFSKAQIIFTNSEGTIINVLDIKEKGKGSLRVFADDLTNGLYTYTLVVDGKTIDGKKMIKD